jgi:tetratricopeptide (TPR) repeat protein
MSSCHYAGVVIGLWRSVSGKRGSVLGTNKFGFLRNWDLSLRCPALFCLGVLFLLIIASGISIGQQQTVPPAPPSPLEQAEKLLKEGRPDEALSLLTTFALKNPKAPGLEADFGNAYFQLRQFSEATKHLKAALVENASDLQSTQLLAISFYSLGNCDDALPLLEKLGPKIPRNIPDSPYLTSICYVMTQQLDKARDSLARFFLVPPDSAMAYLTLAKLMVRQQMVEKAVPQIETALRLDPRLPMAHFLLGEINLYQSNPQSAVVEFQKELTVNPTLWLVYWRLGDSYARSAKYDEAEKALKEAIWLNDGSADAIALLGEIALKKNDPSLASGFLERALSLDPQNLDAHVSLAKAYKELGRESEANQQMEIVRKLQNQKHSNQESSSQLVP